MADEVLKSEEEIIAVEQPLMRIVSMASESDVESESEENDKPGMLYFCLNVYLVIHIKH